MGAYKFENANPPVLGGFRGPINKDPDCGCGSVHLAPRFLRPLVRRIVLPATMPTVTEKDLHPEVDRVVSALLNLKDATARSKARNGKEVGIAFTKPARTGDDFGMDVTIAVGGANVFAGRLVARNVWKR